LTKKKYFTAPSIATLSSLSDEELSSVVDFVVGKDECGSVQFLGSTDVRSLNLDKIVQFSPAEISVYPNEHDKAPQVRFKILKILFFFNFWKFTIGSFFLFL